MFLRLIIVTALVLFCPISSIKKFKDQSMGSYIFCAGVDKAFAVSKIVKVGTSMYDYDKKEGSHKFNEKAAFSGMQNNNLSLSIMGDVLFNWDAFSPENMNMDEQKDQMKFEVPGYEMDNYNIEQDMESVAFDNIGNRSSETRLNQLVSFNGKSVRKQKTKKKFVLNTASRLAKINVMSIFNKPTEAPETHQRRLEGVRKASNERPTVLAPNFTPLLNSPQNRNPGLSIKSDDKDDPNEEEYLSENLNNPKITPVKRSVPETTDRNGNRAKRYSTNSNNEQIKENVASGEHQEDGRKIVANGKSKYAYNKNEKGMNKDDPKQIELKMTHSFLNREGSHGQVGTVLDKLTKNKFDFKATGVDTLQLLQEQAQNSPIFGQFSERIKEVQNMLPTGLGDIEGKINLGSIASMVSKFDISSWPNSLFDTAKTGGKHFVWNAGDKPVSKLEKAETNRQGESNFGSVLRSRNLRSFEGSANLDILKKGLAEMTENMVKNAVNNAITKVHTLEESNAGNTVEKSGTVIMNKLIKNESSGKKVNRNKPDAGPAKIQGNSVSVDSSVQSQKKLRKPEANYQEEILKKGFTKTIEAQEKMQKYIESITNKYNQISGRSAILTLLPVELRNVSVKFDLGLIANMTNNLNFKNVQKIFDGVNFKFVGSGLKDLTGGKLSFGALSEGFKKLTSFNLRKIERGLGKLTSGKLNFSESETEKRKEMNSEDHSLTLKNDFTAGEKTFRRMLNIGVGFENFLTKGLTKLTKLNDAKYISSGLKIHNIDISENTLKSWNERIIEDNGMNSRLKGMSMGLNKGEVKGGFNVMENMINNGLSQLADTPKQVDIDVKGLSMSSMTVTNVKNMFQEFLGGRSLRSVISSLGFGQSAPGVDLGDQLRSLFLTQVQGKNLEKAMGLYANSLGDPQKMKKTMNYFAETFPSVNKFHKGLFAISKTFTNPFAAFSGLGVGSLTARMISFATEDAERWGDGMKELQNKMPNYANNAAKFAKTCSKLFGNLNGSRGTCKSDSSGELRGLETGDKITSLAGDNFFIDMADEVNQKRTSLVAANKLKSDTNDEVKDSFSGRMLKVVQKSFVGAKQWLHKIRKRGVKKLSKILGQKIQAFVKKTFNESLKMRQILDGAATKLGDYFEKKYKAYKKENQKKLEPKKVEQVKQSGKDDAPKTEKTQMSTRTERLQSIRTEPTQGSTMTESTQVSTRTESTQISTRTDSTQIDTEVDSTQMETEVDSTQRSVRDDGKKSESGKDGKKEKKPDKKKEGDKKGGYDAMKAVNAFMDAIAVAANTCGQLREYYNNREIQKGLIKTYEAVRERVRELVRFFDQATQIFIDMAEEVVTAIKQLISRIEERSEQTIIDSFRKFQRRSSVVLELFSDQMDDFTRKNQYRMICYDPSNNPESILDELVQLLNSEINYFDIIIEHGNYADDAFEQSLLLSSGNLQLILSAWRTCDQILFNGDIPRVYDRKLQVRYNEQQYAVFQGIVRLNKKREQNYFQESLIFGNTAEFDVYNTIRGYNEYFTKKYTLFHFDEWDYSLHAKYRYSFEWGGRAVHRRIEEPEFHIRYNPEFVKILTINTETKFSLDDEAEFLFMLIPSFKQMDKLFPLIRQNMEQLLEFVKEQKEQFEREKDRFINEMAESAGTLVISGIKEVGKMFLKKLGNWLAKPIKAVQNLLKGDVVGFFKDLFSNIIPFIPTKEDIEEIISETKKSARASAIEYYADPANHCDIYNEVVVWFRKKMAECGFQITDVPLPVGVTDNDLVGKIKYFKDDLSENLEQLYHYMDTAQQKQTADPNYVLKYSSIMRIMYSDLLNNTILMHMKLYNMLDKLGPHGEELMGLANAINGFKKLMATVTPLIGNLIPAACSTAATYLRDNFSLETGKTVLLFSMAQRVPTFVNNRARYSTLLRRLMFIMPFKASFDLKVGVHNVANMNNTHALKMIDKLLTYLDTWKVRTREGLQGLNKLLQKRRRALHIVRSTLNSPQEAIPDELRDDVRRDVHKGSSIETIFEKNKCRLSLWRMVSIYETNVSYGVKRHMYEGFGNCLMETRKSKEIQVVWCYYKDYHSCDNNQSKVIDCWLNQDTTVACNKEEIQRGYDDRKKQWIGMIEYVTKPLSEANLVRWFLRYNLEWTPPIYDPTIDKLKHLIGRQAQMYESMKKMRETVNETNLLNLIEIQRNRKFDDFSDCNNEYDKYLKEHNSSCIQYLIDFAETTFNIFITKDNYTNLPRLEEAEKTAAGGFCKNKIRKMDLVAGCYHCANCSEFSYNFTDCTFATTKEEFKAATDSLIEIYNKQLEGSKQLQLSESVLVQEITAFQITLLAFAGKGPKSAEKVKNVFNELMDSATTHYYRKAVYSVGQKYGQNFRCDDKFETCSRE